MDIDVDSLMTIDEVAKFLDVHVKTVRRLLKCKTIPQPIVLSERCKRWHRGTLVKWVRTGVLPKSDNGKAEPKRKKKGDV